MESELRPIVQNCYVNGKLCRNGKRSDFEADPVTGERALCNKWIKLIGPDPQTGKDIETWCCSEFAKIKLALENSSMTRRVVSAIDRNNDVFFNALPPAIQERVMQNSAQPKLEATNGI